MAGTAFACVGKFLPKASSLAPGSAGGFFSPRLSARNALTGSNECSFFVRMDLPTESRLIVLMRDLERLSETLKAAVEGIAHEAHRVAIAALEMNLENDLRPDLCYRLEQWDSDSLARTVSAGSSLYIAIAGWQEAVKLDPRSTWLLRQRAHVLKEHKPSYGARRSPG
jgi:hypothetical protein